MPAQGTSRIPRVGDPQRFRYLSAGLVPASEMTPDERRAGWATPRRLLAEVLDGRPWPPAPIEEGSAR
jgi:hypothetical protein